MKQLLDYALRETSENMSPISRERHQLVEAEATESGHLSLVKRLQKRWKTLDDSKISRNVPLPWSLPPHYFLDIFSLKWEVGLEKHQSLWLAAPQSVGGGNMTAPHNVRREQEWYRGGLIARLLRYLALGLVANNRKPNKRWLEGGVNVSQRTRSCCPRNPACCSFSVPSFFNIWLSSSWPQDSC